MALIKTPDGGFYLDDSQVNIDYEANSVTILGGEGTAGVISFNGRAGAVVPANGDYTPEMVGARPADWMPTAADVGAVPTTGGTMTGALMLGGDPTLPLQAATKQYVDDLDDGILNQIHDIVDGTTPIPTQFPADGGTFNADAMLTGTDNLELTVPGTGESATVGITGESVTLVHNTNSDADASVRVASESVELEGGSTTVNINGSGVNFNGAVLSGISSIGGNSGEIAVENVVDMNNHKITGLANGTEATDAATVGQIPTNVINSLPNQMFVDLVNVQRTATTNTAQIQIATRQSDGTYSTAVQHGVLTLIGAGQGVDGVNGAGLMIASDKAKLDGIPTPTTADNGKILCVENGAYVLKTLAELQG